ncbi:hypothetical protein GGQ99_001623 [Aminobacter niigataensis]|uniref:PD-(D/E)XK nuclease superfamily protein n=1 Tax=Aminobacter niigataensis TaxID=83265 RepID=A0ABR6KZE2_9HYPH|nr:PD-(D/E)XK nuclease family protein [Aminobacter niigataensis]MBB4649901.1 hypothetical protein [Aminobacter niigataensis]
MSDTHANLLLSLFQWRPSDKRISAENFLTEAFVYCLRVNVELRKSWLDNILGQAISDADFVITTRASHLDDERASTIYPDIDIRGTLASGEGFTVLVEVKWGAPYSKEQIGKYDRLLASAENPHLVFISPSAMDCRRAEGDSESLTSTFRAVRWDQLFSYLSASSDGCRATRELLEFMDQQGLSPQEPISQSLLGQYLATKHFTKRLWRYCEKLMNEFDWDFLPKYYQAPEVQSVKEQYGRVAIVFMRSGWNGTITIGFLYSNHDHKVKFADGSDNSVDLMMRIESFSNVDGRDEVVSILRRKVAEARKAGGVVHVASGSSKENGHTLYISQKSLQEYLADDSELNQLAAMHQQIKDWSKALFRDGELEVALNRLDAQQPQELTATLSARIDGLAEALPADR